MTDQVLLDNDLALKIACYALVREALAIVGRDGVRPGMLGVARFVLRSRIERGRGIVSPSHAMQQLQVLLENVNLLEPTEDELALAADLEAEAQRLEHELDGGESQLLAILAHRGLRLLLTGDKRAIVAMSVVAPGLASSKIACLEQFMAEIISLAGVEPVRAAVCNEPSVDKAITACFGCSRPSATEADVIEGLASYTGHLSRSAPGVLADVIR